MIIRRDAMGAFRGLNRRENGLLLAGRHLTRRLFGGMLRRIATLPLPDWVGGLQSAANFGDDLVAEGNVSAESIGKWPAETLPRATVWSS
jgi:hypothetical protein